MTPRAGQVWSARARRGERHVQVEQVRGLASGNAYALVREVLPGGEAARGWLRGVPRDVLFAIALTWREGALTMPERYRLVQS